MWTSRSGRHLVSHTERLKTDAFVGSIIIDDFIDLFTLKFTCLVLKLFSHLVVIEFALLKMNKVVLT
jgi:hypothetical protein